MRPAVLVEYMYSIPSAPFTCSSIGEATFCDTVSALAPGYVADTWICGGVMLGYWAIGNDTMATRPAMVMMIEITAEKIGRSIKNFENMIDQPRPVIGRGALWAPVGCSEPVPVHSECQVPVVPPSAEAAWVQVPGRPAWPVVSDPVPG